MPKAPTGQTPPLAPLVVWCVCVCVCVCVCACRSLPFVSSPSPAILLHHHTTIRPFVSSLLVLFLSHCHLLTLFSKPLVSFPSSLASCPPPSLSTRLDSPPSSLSLSPYLTVSCLVATTRVAKSNRLSRKGSGHQIICHLPRSFLDQTYTRLVSSTP